MYFIELKKHDNFLNGFTCLSKSKYKIKWFVSFLFFVLED